MSDKVQAKEIITKMIDYGRNNKYLGLWNFCGPEHMESLSNEDILGRCTMTPSVVATIYDLAVYLGYECDDDCNTSRTIFVQLPKNGSGFSRHLYFIGVLLRGKIEGAINGIQLNSLEDGVSDEKNNALYQAIYHTFLDGNQEKALSLLNDESKFPKDRVANSTEYCTDYLYQRDEYRDGVENKDWLPCPEEGDIEKPMIEWLFAEAIASGRIK